MPGPPVVPVNGDEALPDKVDVVVIGGGIVGCSTALELAEQGQKVALCEKGGIGQEQSSRNWGWVRISRRDPREIPLMAEALRIWPALAKRTGRDLGYKKSGILFACKDNKTLRQYRQWKEQLTPFQIRCAILTRSQVDEMLPGHKMDVTGALWTPDDGRAEPQMATPAIAEAARDAGASILTKCAVRGLETSAGSISGVVTERGSIACDAVVLAGGVWSRLFSGNIGFDLPQLKVMNTVLRTKPLEGGPECATWIDDFAFRKRQDGGYTISSGNTNVVDIVPDSFRLARHYLPALSMEWRSLRFRLSQRFMAEASLPRKWRMVETSPFESCRVLDPKPSGRIVQKALSAAAKDFPVFRNAEITQKWAGYIDVTPDAVPVISAIDDLPGFYMATGFSGHGFGIGPAAGRLMSEIVLGKPTIVDPADFRFSRFSDGSEIQPISGF